MEVVAEGERLDSADGAPVRLHGEHEARAHRLFLELNGAGAAHAVLTADVRPGEPLGTDAAGEKGARLDLAPVDAAVDRDGDRPGHGAARARSAARTRALRVSSAASARR